MPNDFVYLFAWWLVFLFLGISSIPLIWLLFKRFFDIGYGFAKSVGLLAVTFVIFLVGTFKLVPFTFASVLFIFLGYIFLNIYIFFSNKPSILKALSKKTRIIIAQEIIFTIGLLLWSAVRGYQPDIVGLEKLMDFGFINSILQSKYLPPADMWFSGNSINYYWFGHLTIAVATKLSRIPSTITYNLSLATILGIALTSTFSLITTLVKGIGKLNKNAIVAAGIISAVLLVFAGSFHTPVYLLKEGSDSYWYPDATRFIGYDPETQDKTIHEFPLYSFVVSDLHAHLINFPFVLLYLGLLWTLINKAKSKISLKNILPLGFVLGVMFMTSTWDFANYLLVSGVLLGLINLKRHGLNFKSIFESVKTILPIIIISLIFASPFIFNFKSLAQGIKLVDIRTPLWQLAVLWGFPAITTIIFTLSLGKHFKKLKTQDIFIFALLISSWVLIILPELIYVKDIYIASHKRANTMFKLTYQAYVMFYLSTGYIVARVLTLIKKRYLRAVVSAFFALILFSILLYPYFAIKSYYGGLKNYRGLRGDTWLLTQYPEIYQATTWLKENVSGQPTILEAPGDSYTNYNVISSYSGLPTVSGWFVHEWLWRGDSSFPQERVNDITQIYTTTNDSLATQLLNKYKVEYVIVGAFEFEKFSNLSEQKFSQIGTLVFSSGNTRIYQIY